MRKPNEKEIMTGIEGLKDKLKELRLKAMTEQLEDVLEMASQKNHDFILHSTPFFA